MVVKCRGDREGPDRRGRDFSRGLNVIHGFRLTNAGLQEVVE